MNPSDSRKRKRNQPHYQGPPAELLAHVPNMPNLNNSSASPENHEELDGDTITVMPPARKRRKETFFLDPVTGKPILPTPESEVQSPLPVLISHASNSELIVEQGRGSLYATEILPVPSRELKSRPLSSEPNPQHVPTRELSADSELSSVPSESIEGVTLESIESPQEESRVTTPLPPPMANKTQTIPVRQHEEIEPELLEDWKIREKTLLKAGFYSKEELAEQKIEFMDRARKQRNIPPSPSPVAPVKRRRGRPRLTDRLITPAKPADNDQEEQDPLETPAPVLDISAGTAAFIQSLDLGGHGMAIEAEMMRLAAQKKLSMGYYDDEMRLDARRISPPPEPRCHWSKRIRKEDGEL